jgi:hypothetical protein
MLNLYHFKRANYENYFILVFNKKKYIFSTIHLSENNYIVFLTEQENNESINHLINTSYKITISQLFEISFNRNIIYKKNNLIFKHGGVLYTFNLKSYFRILKLKKLA